MTGWKSKLGIDPEISYQADKDSCFESEMIQGKKGDALNLLSIPPIADMS